MSEVMLSPDFQLVPEQKHAVVEESKPNSRQVGVKFAEESVDSVSNTKSTESQSKEAFFDSVREHLEKLNEFIPIQSTNLVFEFDELGDPPVIKVIDKDSSEVIREIPSKEFSEMAKALDNFADKLNQSGMIFNETV